MKEIDRRFKNAVSEGDLLTFYEYCNSPDFAEETWDIEGKFWLRADLSSNFGRIKLANWEVRNLNMASHIVKATVFNTYKKVLVVVGLGHKVFLERYLAHMLDLSTIQLSDI